MTQSNNTPPPIPGLLQHMRTIRDQISHEIKDMTFEEERAYLDKLLAGSPPNSEPTPS